MSKRGKEYIFDLFKGENKYHSINLGLVLLRLQTTFDKKHTEFIRMVLEFGNVAYKILTQFTTIVIRSR